MDDICTCRKSNFLFVEVSMSALNIEAAPPQLVTAWWRLSSEPVTRDRGTIGDGV